MFTHIASLLIPARQNDWRSECLGPVHSETNSLLGDRLQVVGLVDFNRERAETVLKAKQISPDFGKAYAETVIFSSLEEAAEGLQMDLQPQ